MGPNISIRMSLNSAGLRAPSTLATPSMARESHSAAAAWSLGWKYCTNPRSFPNATMFNSPRSLIVRGMRFSPFGSPRSSATAPNAVRCVVVSALRAERPGLTSTPMAIGSASGCMFGPDSTVPIAPQDTTRTHMTKTQAAQRPLARPASTVRPHLGSTPDRATRFNHPGCPARSFSIVGFRACLTE